MSQEEQLVAGAYTALGKMNIRAGMHTNAGIVGGYSNGDPFTVFEVYPEKDGIVWGRVSSNTGGGSLRFTALRVNNHPKAHLEKAFEETPSTPMPRLEMWIRELDQWARANGYNGPKPFKD